MIDRYPGIITALSPIHHGSDELTGNVKLFRSIKMVVADGRVERVPLISGNAIRGRLRRMIMRDMLQRVGYDNRSAKLHHMLYSGGILEGVDETDPRTDIGFRRQLIETLPPIAILGTAMGNFMIDGILRCDHALPICAETAHLTGRVGAHDHRSLSDFTFITKKNDRPVNIDEPDEVALQMIASFEVMAPGTQFTHAFALRDPSDIERSCLGQMIALWREDPTIGGKSGEGYGLVALDYPDTPSPDLYLAFLDDTANTIHAFLDDLAARLSPRARKSADVTDAA